MSLLPRGSGGGVTGRILAVGARRSKPSLQLVACSEDRVLPLPLQYTYCNIKTNVRLPYITLYRIEPGLALECICPLGDRSDARTHCSWIWGLSGQALVPRKQCWVQLGNRVLTRHERNESLLHQERRRRATNLLSCAGGEPERSRPWSMAGCRGGRDGENVLHTPAVEDRRKLV